VITTTNSPLFRERLASAESEFGGINDHLTPPHLAEQQRPKPIAAAVYIKNKIIPGPLLL
jgi:hypothetical protein